MSEQICLRGEGGGIFPMDLPLSPPIQQRYDRGDLVRVNPDGTTWAPPAPQATARKTTGKPAAK